MSARWQELKDFHEIQELGNVGGGYREPLAGAALAWSVIIINHE